MNPCEIALGNRGLEPERAYLCDFQHDLTGTDERSGADKPLEHDALALGTNLREALIDLGCLKRSSRLQNAASGLIYFASRSGDSGTGSTDMSVVSVEFRLRHRHLSPRCCDLRLRFPACRLSGLHHRSGFREFCFRLLDFGIGGCGLGGVALEFLTGDSPCIVEFRRASKLLLPVGLVRLCGLSLGLRARF